jgi:cholest-4-en-3-one 26-monooxygenase
MQSSPTLEIGPELIDPACYARDGYPHEAFRALRRESPVYWYDQGPISFWAITKHADIVEICRQPELFSNLPHFQIVVNASFGSDDAREPATIIQMDPPEHRLYRELVSRRFTPRALQSVEAALEPLADEILSRLESEARSGECDFVEKVSAPFPMAVISWLLDVPRDDWPMLYEWSNAVAVPNDPDHQQEGEDAHEARLRASASLYDYFLGLADERRGGDADDIVSLLARAQVGGEPLDPHILGSYYMLLIVAGNETTRNAFSGGLQAIIERPAVWEELESDPSAAKIANAAEEMLRWSTPVANMARTATRDTELRGQKIRAGETVALFYASANRDEDVFDHPFEFRLNRKPNPHLAFGVGEHFCVGADLARIEIRCLLRRLLARCRRFEAAGPATRLPASSVGGLKTLPVRYAFK